MAACIYFSLCSAHITYGLITFTQSTHLSILHRLRNELLVRWSRLINWLSLGDNRRLESGCSQTHPWIHFWHQILKCVYGRQMKCVFLVDSWWNKGCERCLFCLSTVPVLVTSVSEWGRKEHEGDTGKRRKIQRGKHSWLPLPLLTPAVRCNLHSNKTWQHCSELIFEVVILNFPLFYCSVTWKCMNVLFHHFLCPCASVAIAKKMAYVIHGFLQEPFRYTVQNYRLHILYLSPIHTMEFKVESLNWIGWYVRVSC